MANRNTAEATAQPNANSIWGRKVLPTLSGKYQATVVEYKEVTHDSRGNALQNGGYMEVTFQLPDRKFKYNIFPGHGDTEFKQINYITGAIRRQLDKDDEELSLIEVLELAKTTPIDVWFTYNQEYNRVNVAFHEAQEAVSIEDIERVL